MVASSRQIKRVLVRRRTSAPKTHPRGDLLPAAVDVRDLQDAYQAGVEDGQPRGWSGTAVAGGYIEGVEPNTDLRNRAWRGYTNSPGIGEQMYLTDGAVAASANEWIERAQNADWRIDPGDTDDPDGQMHAEFARRNLFELSATSWLSNARNFAKAIMWGCALAETIFARDSKDEAPTFQKVEGRRLARWEETGQFDRDHYILTDLAPRLPTSIEEWRQDTETGSFDGIVQTSPLDNTARSGSFGEVFIGAEHLVLVTYGGDGNNWEGFSRFRSVYIPWKARQTLLRMGVIAAERFGVGVPIAKQTEDGWADRAGAKAAWAEVKRQVARYRGGAQAWMALPFGVDVEVQEPALPAAQHVLALYNQMAMDIHIAGETQHLIQGTQQVGTYGLREGQSSEFKATINPFLRAIARAVNKSVIKPLIDLNWLGVKRYPELTFGDQQHGSTKEDMEAYQIGVTSGAVTPQIEDEEFFRSRFQWPEMTEESEEARTNEPAAVEPEPVIEPPEDEEPEVVAGACGCGCSEMFGTVPFEDEPSDGSPAADVRLLAESKFDANTSRMSRVEAVERTSIRLAAQVQTLVLTPYLKKIEPALESGDAAAIAKTPIPGRGALIRTLRNALADVAVMGRSEVKREIKRQEDDPEFQVELAAALEAWAPAMFAENPSGMENGIDEVVDTPSNLAKRRNLAATTTATNLLRDVDSTVNSYIQQTLPDKYDDEEIRERVKAVITPRTISKDVTQDVNTSYTDARAAQGRAEETGTVVYTLNPEIGINGPHEPCVECVAVAEGPDNPAIVGSNAEERLQVPNPNCDSTKSGINNCWCANVYLKTPSIDEAARAGGLA